MTPAERMRAYRARKRAAGLKCVSEWVSVDSLDPVAYSDHRLLDARSLAMHCKIARKISKDQSLLAIPQRNLERWRQRASDEPSKFIAEWQDILDEPWPGVMVFITGCSEKAMRLRQSSPFAGVLSARERKQIYDAFRD
jgi:hypothetical protein